MIEQRWDVIAVCELCGLMLRVDLRAIAILAGPKTSLWNAKARCKKVGCLGFVGFRGRAPDGMAMHEPLVGPHADGRA